MSTGVQRSGAVAPATRTILTQAVGPKSDYVSGLGNDRPRIAMAHETLHKCNGIRG